MNRKRYFAKNTALFAIHSLGTKLIVFLMVPVYTNVFSSDDYGIVDLVTTLSTILVPVMFLNIYEGIQRFCLDEAADHFGILSVGFIGLAFSLLFGLILLPVSNLFRSIAPFSILLYLYCISQGTCLIFTSYLRGREKLNHFAICNILITFIAASLNILFLVILKTGIQGYFWSFIIAYTIGTVYALISGRAYSIISHFLLKKDLFIKLLMYSIVLVPNTLMWWIMNASDRIMIISMVGLSANGIYGVSYKLPSVISTLSTVFNQAWSFSAIKEDGSNDRSQLNNKMYDAFFCFQLVITFCLMFFLRIFMKFYVEESYYEAWKYTVPLLVGNFFMSLGTFLSVQYTVNKDSKGFLFSSSAGAVVNVVLNLILIPILGPMGAAIATMISYFSVFAFRIRNTKKYIDIKAFDRKKMLLMFMLALVSCTVFVDNIVYRIAFMIIESVAACMIMRKDVFELATMIIKCKNGKHR